MKTSKAVRPVLELAQELGYQVSRTKGGHLRFGKPGHRTVFSSSTPSDWRTQRNIIAELRRNERMAH